MRFLPQRARKPSATEGRQSEFGGFQFQNQGFQFYKHPPAEAYGLNKLLFESRHSADLRERIINDFDAVADEYDLARRAAQGGRGTDARELVERSSALFPREAAVKNDGRRDAVPARQAGTQVHQRVAGYSVKTTADSRARRSRRQSAAIFDSSAAMPFARRRRAR